MSKLVSFKSAASIKVEEPPTPIYTGFITQTLSEDGLKPQMIGEYGGLYWAVRKLGKSFVMQKTTQQQRHGAADALQRIFSHTQVSK
jgi:hypothetical protein